MRLFYNYYVVEHPLITQEVHIPNKLTRLIVGKIIGSLPELLVIIDTILLKYGNIMAIALVSH
jgi:hypothetical protein